ncbi:hypothetical protein LR48_Vigan06g074700 [Vigna angularis]|uniref:Uncharacterized protein n=1 Tax=Phaseolus angularis TaxID=3914 RepID=A0A0L9URX1_PHAAN|nr:hypothetical protein LR48_Vigan06g074700 [Vigna angularis]
MVERPYKALLEIKAIQGYHSDRTVYKRIYRTVILNKKGSVSSSSTSPSAHMHTDDHCNDKDEQTKHDKTGTQERDRTLGARPRGLQFQNRFRLRGYYQIEKETEYNQISQGTNGTNVNYQVSQLDELTLEDFNRTPK